MAKQPSPNDNRSNVMNPNNPAYQANIDNRSAQLDPQQSNSSEAPAAPAAPAPTNPNSNSK